MSDASEAPKGALRRFLDMPPDSVVKTVIVAVTLIITLPLSLYK